VESSTVAMKLNLQGDRRACSESKNFIKTVLAPTPPTRLANEADSWRPGRGQGSSSTTMTEIAPLIWSPQGHSVPLMAMLEQIGRPVRHYSEWPTPAGSHA
jgi:hypothetical protein